VFDFQHELQQIAVGAFYLRFDAFDLFSLASVGDLQRV
jgi:hypothetical protein